MKLNQDKIGKFIAAMRKRKGITQRDLAEQLGISDKTVSKWECGKGMPDNVLMLPLCDILQISANELLSGEQIYSMQDAENNISQLLEETELRKRRYMFQEQYGLEIETIERTKMGAGAVVYIATCKDGRYIIKYASENSMNHPELEAPICTYLQKYGIPTCPFIRNRQGEYLSADENGRLYSVQLFHNGKTYGYHEAPEWLMVQSAQMLGRIHKALKSYEQVPIGIGEDYFTYMTPENARKSYEKSIIIAKTNGDTAIVEDLEYRIGLMKRFEKREIDFARLTCQASHGDYIINQLICGEEHIHAVIDWSTCCIQPVAWEIFRSFAYASPNCKDGEIDVEQLLSYVSYYLQYATLNKYDLEMMPYLFYYQSAVCDYYGQYYASIMDSRKVYLEQAVFSTKLLSWLEKNLEQLSHILCSKIDL